MKLRLTDLHASTETEDQVKSRFLLDVVIRERTAVLKLLSRKDQALLIRRNALLVLNLGLYIIDGIARLNLQSDGLSSN